jgi:hypothetical protein
MEYQNKRYTTNRKDDRGTDGRTNFILRTKDQETRLIHHEYDVEDDEELIKELGNQLSKLHTNNDLSNKLTNKSKSY